MSLTSSRKTSQQLEGIYSKLHQFFGPQHWWPGETPFEVTVGAILTQNTAWTNVEKAICNLKNAKVLNISALSKISSSRMAHLIKPAGFFNIKTKRLMAWMHFLIQKGCKNNLDPLQAIPTPQLRHELLKVKGIGPETADSILLYALERSVFVVDAYTQRILKRHNLVSEGATYDEIQSFFEKNLVGSGRLFNEYHALIVAIGKSYCKSTAKCEACPLNYLFGGKIPDSANQ